MSEDTTTGGGYGEAEGRRAVTQGPGELDGSESGSTLASTNGPSGRLEDGEQVLQHYRPDDAFERFVKDRWQGLSGEARELALDAFFWGGCAFGEGLVAILELEPATPTELDIAQDIRRMVELARRG